MTFFRGHQAGFRRFLERDGEQLGRDMAPLVKEMFLNDAVIGDVKFGLVKEQISETVMDEAIVPKFHRLGDVALAAVDNHRSGINTDVPNDPEDAVFANAQNV